jgi:hypothetical protein
MNAINELFDVLVGSVVEPVEPTKIKPSQQYFVVLDGLDAEIDLKSRIEFFKRDLPERILNQMDISITNDADGETIDVCDPGLGRHLYRMSGTDARRLIVNLMLFAEDVLHAAGADSTELRRMTDDDILADFVGGFDQGLRLMGINITVYDVNSIFRDLTLGK